MNLKKTFIALFLLTGFVVGCNTQEKKNRISSNEAYLIDLYAIESGGGHNLPVTIVNDLKRNFMWMYRTGNTNSDYNVNDLKVRYSLISPYLYLKHHTYASDTGVAFSYVLTPNINPNKLSYLISNYCYDPITHELRQLGLYDSISGHFKDSFILLTGNSFQIITHATASLYMTAYNTNFSINRFSSIVTDKIHDFPNQGTPKLCFYNKSQFHQFLVDNIPTPTINDTLVVANGAVSKDNILPPANNPSIYDYKFHTSILYWKSGIEIMLSDEINDIMHPYSYKSMDVGVLCPPDCHK